VRLYRVVSRLANGTFDRLECGYQGLLAQCEGEVAARPFQDAARVVRRSP